MPILLVVVSVILGYLIGSIPFGLFVVKLSTGKDIRQVESGRTGGTNALRAAGLWAGLATAFLDILKGACAVWVARWLTGGNAWAESLAPLAAILGHNYSLYLIERGEDGRIKLRGGAGAATCVGGAMALWAPSVLILVPMGALILYFVGYASVATMSVGLVAASIFAIRYWAGLDVWQHILYGLLAFLAMLWALRPNIKRLAEGSERLVGLRAQRRKKKAQQEAHSSSETTSS